MDPSALFDVRLVDWTLRQLASFQRQIDADHDWFGRLGAEYYASEVYPLKDAVRVRYKADTTAIEGAIADHLGNPGWIFLRMEGAPAWNGPRGTLAITVVDKTGRPVPNVACRLEAVDLAVHLGDAAWQTESNGTCFIHDPPAVAYQFSITGPFGDGMTIELGSGHITVPSDGEAKVEIAVDRP